MHPQKINISTGYDLYVNRRGQCWTEHNGHKQFIKMHKLPMTVLSKINPNWYPVATLVMLHLRVFGVPETMREIAEHIEVTPRRVSNALCVLTRDRVVDVCGHGKEIKYFVPKRRV